jgi:predicted DNA-binding ribbon-helix-helix protein
MKSSNRKHSVLIGGHKTSVSLEDDFWKSLRYIASGRGETLCDLLVKIDAERNFANLSSAIRLFVLRCYREQLDKQQRRDTHNLMALNSMTKPL